MIILFSTNIGETILTRILNSGFKRLDLFNDAFSKFYRYPFGGFSPSGDLSNIQWYHNYFIDICRLCGFGGLILAATLSLYSFYWLIKNYPRLKSREESFIIYIFMLAFGLMQQDVIIEGNPVLLLIFIMCSIFLIEGRERNHEHAI
jgi:hypothetical protein